MTIDRLVGPPAVKREAFPARADSDERVSVYFWWALGLLACGAVLPFWVGEYMPLVDLPQHAAQLSINQRWNDPAFHYHDFYRVNWYTNQLFAYELTRLFALAMPLVYAIKCMLSLALLALAASVYWLVRTLRGDPWWTLLALPIGFSFSLYWGLFNYIVALPLGLTLIVVSTRYALTPSRGRALVVFATANLLFVSHALILAYAGLISAVVVVARTKSWRAKLFGCVALASVLPTVAIWWTGIRSHEPTTAPTGFYIGWGLHRISDFFSYQVGSTAGNWREIAIGGALFFLPFLLGARPSRALWRWVPLSVTVLLFAFLPVAALDIDLLYGRVAAFALPTLLFALDRGRSRPWQHALIAGFVALRLAYVAAQFASFDAEARSLDTVLAAAEPGKRMLYLPSNYRSQVIHNDAYAHFGCWYQVKKGGVVDYSFAELFPTWYRYRANMEPSLPEEFDSNTHLFRYPKHDGRRFDYFLARGPVLDAWFVGANVTPRVVAKAAEWTLLAARP
jgi:hypothetical protein